RDHRAIARKAERAKLSVDAREQREPEDEPERADDAGVPFAPRGCEPDREPPERFGVMPRRGGSQEAAAVGEPFVETDESVDVAAEHPGFRFQEPRGPCVP